MPKADEQALTVAEPSMPELVRQALTSGQVPPERLPALLEAMFTFQLKVDAVQAEKEFTRDFSAALQEMPTVMKRGKIDMGTKGSMNFARYDDVDAAIRPIEARYGFARSFSTAPCADGILMTLRLSHRGGHSETSTLQMPPDTGAGRNGMQARGSASSYAKRYLTLDKWNIITAEERADNDAATAEPISQEQADNINTAIAALELDKTQKERYLKWIPATSVSAIQRNLYERATRGLKDIERKKREAGK